MESEITMGSCRKTLTPEMERLPFKEGVSRRG